MNNSLKSFLGIKELLYFTRYKPYWDYEFDLFRIDAVSGLLECYDENRNRFRAVVNLHQLNVAWLQEIVDDYYGR
jgi:hypothetical protein